ncbi:microtubule-associated proteins 1A/1B light chain 3C [Equus przewalskii]|uniref:Microtubule-associated proteins 1A/1B light chain 3C n=1 Tax=Equus przewalskii TaxID=9798 RepID=A0ABM4MZI2_EQUPR
MSMVFALYKRAGTAVEETADSAEKRECQPLRRSCLRHRELKALIQKRVMLTLLKGGGGALPREQFLPALDKTKFLGPQGLTVTQFQGVMRSRMVLGATEAFHLLVNHRSVASVSVTVAEIYRDCKDEDGFVYMTCTSQEVFGGLGSAAASWGQTLPSSPARVDTVL